MPPWYNLPKTADDNTTIDAEIDAKIATHNADSQAHLAEDESLESHRTNPVVDHPAESVVNDKLQLSARTYIAIVDPTDEEAFDTIAGAVTYARANGGGNIYIKRGTHTISTVITMYQTISLYGEGIDETIITFDDTLPGQLVYDDDPSVTTGLDVLPETQNLTFIFNEIESAITYAGVTWGGRYNSVKMGTGYYCLYIGHPGSYFENCIIECGAGKGVITIEEPAVFDRCIFNATANNSDGPEAALGCLFKNCQFKANGYTNHDWLDNVGQSSFEGNNIESLGSRTIASASLDTTYGAFRYIGNTIQMGSSQQLQLGADKMIFCNNRVNGSNSNLIIATGADYNIVTGNILYGNITNNGTGNVVADNITGQA